jgi:hypothetical protein
MRSLLVVSIGIVLLGIAATPTSVSAAFPPTKWSGCWQGGSDSSWTDQWYLNITTEEWPDRGELVTYSGNFTTVKGQGLGNTGSIDNGTLNYNGVLKFTVHYNGGDAIIRIGAPDAGKSQVNAWFCNSMRYSNICQGSWYTIRGYHSCFTPSSPTAHIATSVPISRTLQAIKAAVPPRPM